MCITCFCVIISSNVLLLNYFEFDTFYVEDVFIVGKCSFEQSWLYKKAWIVFMWLLNKYKSHQFALFIIDIKEDARYRFNM